jgi:photosystem II stability/assembly factor-like uncharacterized protein
LVQRRRLDRCTLAVEPLDDRTLLSTSIPLNPLSWTELGPAPGVDHDPSTGYVENTSGRITGIAADPNDSNSIYIASAGGGVWKTMDGGSNWMPLTDEQPSAPAEKRTLFLGAIALAPSNPDILYVGEGEANMGPSKASEFRFNIYSGHGILKSINGGGSWTLLTGTGDDGTFDNFERRTFSRIVVDPTNPDIVYAAVGSMATSGLPGNTGVWKSTNGGVTWTNTTAADISTTASYTDLVMDPGDPQTLYTAVGTPTGDPANGVWRTRDGGGSWRLVDAGFTWTGTEAGRIALAISPSGSPRTLYAAIADPSTHGLRGLRRSTNGGDSWGAVVAPGLICPEGGTFHSYLSAAGDYHNTLAIDPSNRDGVFAGGLCLIGRTATGSPWFPVADGDRMGPHRDHHALAFDANGHLLDGNDGGIWRLFDPDRDDPNERDPRRLHWKNLNGNLGITQFVGLALHPTDPDRAYGGTQDTGTQRFQDSLAWTRLLRGDGGATVVSVLNPDRVYQITRLDPFRAGCGDIGMDFVRRSDDGGEHWARGMDGITSCNANFYPPLVLDAANSVGDSDRLLLGTDQVFETTDNAQRWSALGDFVFPDHIDALATASNPSWIYASAGGHLFRTQDRGRSWVSIDNIPGPADHFAALLVNPVNRQIVYAVRDRFDGGHVFRSDDGGDNWNDVSGDLPNVPVYAIALDRRFSPRRLYIGTDRGVFSSENGGRHWHPLQTNLPNVQVTQLVLNEELDILAAGTHGRGVWELLVNGPFGGDPGAPRMTFLPDHRPSTPVGELSSSLLAPLVTFSRAGANSDDPLMARSPALARWPFDTNGSSPRGLVRSPEAWGDDVVALALSDWRAEFAATPTVARHVLSRAVTGQGSAHISPPGLPGGEMNAEMICLWDLE